MKVIFYSDKCEFCKKLLAYLEKHDIKNLFKLVNIDKVSPPKEINIVPTIIDTELNQPLKGKKAFEYLLNIKYFNNPTNHIDYIKELPPNPNIPEDDKAVKSKSLNLEFTQNQNEVLINDLFTNSTKNNLGSEQTKNNPNKINFIKYSDFNYNSDKINEEGTLINNLNKNNESIIFQQNNKNETINKISNEMLNQRQIQDKKLSILLQMKKR